MDCKHKSNIVCLLSIFLFPSLITGNAIPRSNASTVTKAITKPNPFTARAYLIRYWNIHITSSLPIPPFLLSKASPLSTADSALLARLASSDSRSGNSSSNNSSLISSHLQLLCSLANLFCSFDDNDNVVGNFPESSHGPDVGHDANFATYANKRFSDYGATRLGGTDSFKNYSEGINTVTYGFKRYTKDGSGHSEEFSSYASDGNVANGSFANYGFGANGGSGNFQNYDPRVNVPNLLFTTYDSDGNDHKLSFSGYSDAANTGNQAFTSYAKQGNGVPAQFVNYGDDANTVGSTFTGYGILGNAGNDTFTNYGVTGNDPHNTFKGYSTGGNSATDSFANYRNGANVGVDTFQSYARSARSAKTTFSNYGKTFNAGNDTFKEYGKGSKGQTTFGFKSYDEGRSFKAYESKGVTFAAYTNVSGAGGSGTLVNRWVEPGRFFRESMLKRGNVMHMPDIADKMPRRSFLPRAISSKLPFSTRRLPDVKEMFHAKDGSATERVILDALRECERAPSAGETKRCVGSAEGMIDFAVSNLGGNITVRTTESTRGSNREVMIGRVEGIDGGRVTESVSCHQSLYPYLIYYCHSVPKVRVYEAEILDAATAGTEVINHGVAICHLDTSAWSPDHGAFVALGPGPGEIEVCHWIFENDMTWTVAH